MPMAPAIRPAFSCAAPSSVEIDWAVACVKLSGRAPYLSWLASVVADSWVKLPEISVPPAIAWLIRGAETTRPSSVMPTELPTLAAVYLAHLAEPADLKSSWTIHSPVVDRVPGWALATSARPRTTWAQRRTTSEQPTTRRPTAPPNRTRGSHSPSGASPGRRRAPG